MFKWLKNKFDPEIDFVGQYLSEKCLYAIFMVGYSLSFILGIFLQDLKYTLFGAIATFLIAFIVVVPSWPFFRKNPVKFVEVAKEKDE